MKIISPPFGELWLLSLPGFSLKYIKSSLQTLPLKEQKYKSANMKSYFGVAKI